MFSTEGTISSYPKVHNIGNPALNLLVSLPETVVSVEEKLDGSQFSFGVDPVHQILTVRSKGAIINPNDPPKLFKLAVESVQAAFAEGKLEVGTVYRGEAITSRRHNSLLYDRFPETGVILFDVEIYNPTTQSWRIGEYEELKARGEALGFEVVRQHAVMSLRDVFGEDMSAALSTLLEIPSMLGGAMTEGVVLKARDLFGVDGKMIVAKYVRPQFRELNDAAWKRGVSGEGLGWENPFAAAVLTRVNRGARWEKALQALRDSGTLEGHPRDIPALMQYVSKDGQDELTPVIEEMARKAWKTVSKGLTRGLAEWYKERLEEEQSAAYAKALEDAPPIPLEQLAAERAEATEP